MRHLVLAAALAALGTRGSELAGDPHRAEEAELDEAALKEIVAYGAERTSWKYPDWPPIEEEVVMEMLGLTVRTLPSTMPTRSPPLVVDCAPA